MKFSAIFVAAAAILVASVSATEPEGVGAVKVGVPVAFEAEVSSRDAQFVKGDAIVHSRSEDLATSKIAVPDSTNPYTKVKGTGALGVALSIENNEESSSSSAGSSATVPLAVGGCAVAAVGIAGFVFMKKRQQQQRNRASSTDVANTPAVFASPANVDVDYKTEMETPV